MTKAKPFTKRTKVASLKDLLNEIDEIFDMEPMIDVTVDQDDSGLIEQTSVPRDVYEIACVLDPVCFEIDGAVFYLRRKPALEKAQKIFARIVKLGYEKRE